MRRQTGGVIAFTLMPENTDQTGVWRSLQRQAHLFHGFLIKVIIVFTGIAFLPPFDESCSPGIGYDADFPACHLG